MTIYQVHIPAMANDFNLSINDNPSAGFTQASIWFPTREPDRRNVTEGPHIAKSGSGSASLCDRNGRSAVSLNSPGPYRVDVWYPYGAGLNLVDWAWTMRRRSIFKLDDPKEPEVRSDSVSIVVRISRGLSHSDYEIMLRRILGRRSKRT